MGRSSADGWCEKRDLGSLNDVQLVALATDLQDAPARNELLLRYYDWAARFVDSQMQHLRLSHSDTLDAHQEAVFWILEAIEHYRPGPAPGGSACCFRTFLYTIMSMRLIDFVRRRSRIERHFDRSARALALVAGKDGASDVARVRPMLRVAELRYEPSRCIQQHEVQSRIHRVLAEADVEARDLWQLTADQGMSLRRAAAELGMSYEVAKRRRRKLVASLRRVLEYLAEM